MTKFDCVPRSYRDVVLGILKHHADDDRFLQVFGEISRVIRTSAQRYENADDATIEAEGEYIDELLGMSFVLLQGKIRRVRQWAKDDAISPTDVGIDDLSCANYKATNTSFIGLV